MNKNVNWEKLARYFADEPPQEERQEVEKTLQNDPDLGKFIKDLQSLRSQARIWKDPCDLESEWEAFTMKARIGEKKPEEMRHSRRFQSYAETRQSHRLSFPYRTVFRVAAMILLILGIAFVSYQVGIDQQDLADDPDQLTMREIATDQGQRVNLRFSDGTKVSLNAASTLRFPERFTGGVREVHLEGEAYFDVVNHNDNQFIVRAGGMTVEVLGTQFNVRAWADDKQVEVVVAEGMVAFRTEDGVPEDAVTITRGFYSYILQDGTIASPEPVSLNTYLAWLEGKLIFDRTPVRDVFKQLERNYNMEIVVQEPSLYDRHITATFSDESIDEIIRALSISLNAHFEREGRRVILVGKE